MSIDQVIYNQLASGVATGFGHTFGQLIIPWVINSWSWLTKSLTGKVTSTGLDAPIAKAVTLKEIKSGIPAGYKLCLFRTGESLNQQVTELLSPPTKLEDNEKLWIIPKEPIAVTTKISHQDATAETEIWFEFIPSDGLGSLLVGQEAVHRSWFQSFITGIAMGVVTNLAKSGISSTLDSANEEVRLELTQNINSAVINKGLRCLAVSPIQQITTCSPPAALVESVKAVKSTEDWSRLVKSLQESGVPDSFETSQKLDQLRDQTLAKTLAPETVVKNLAEITAEAFQKAGITQPDLQRWQNVSQLLEDETTSPLVQVSKLSSEVVATKKPWTWLVWDQVEVDRRQLAYLKRTVNHCQLSCEQSLRTQRDLKVLRQIKEMDQQLLLLKELLSTIPPFVSKTGSLRIPSSSFKSLLQSVETAVITADELVQQMNLLFAQSPTSTTWHDAQQKSMQAAHKLEQVLRDRRQIRG